MVTPNRIAKIQNISCASISNRVPITPNPNNALISASTKKIIVARSILQFSLSSCDLLRAAFQIVSQWLQSRLDSPEPPDVLYLLLDAFHRAIRQRFECLHGDAH